MEQVATHSTTFKILSFVLSICYSFSFTLSKECNDQSADLSTIILHLQSSNKYISPSTANGSNTQSESIRILKVVAGINFMHLNSDDTTQGNIIIELRTPHIPCAETETTTYVSTSELLSFHSFFYISKIPPPDTPPPILTIV